ncbi:MAG: orotate phosphoribosyltransferase [Candidatus Diapherotrites archaeon]|nr:orotate phosphoribosyltransferase [Candidatus Diapherotrites archaeon]
MATEMQKRAAELLLEINAVTLKPEDPYTYKSGNLGPIYTNCRLLNSAPAQRTEMAGLLVRKIEEDLEFKPHVIAGTAMGAISHATLIADRMGLPMVYVRPDEKDHGLPGKVVGELEVGDLALPVEDLITTGGSVLGTARGVKEKGAHVHEALAIFQYGWEEAKENFKKEEVILHTVTDLTAMVEVANEKGVLSDADVELVREWIKDPVAWSNKMKEKLGKGE